MRIGQFLLILCAAMNARPSAGAHTIQVDVPALASLFPNGSLDTKSAISYVANGKVLVTHFEQRICQVERLVRIFREAIDGRKADAIMDIVTFSLGLIHEIMLDVVILGSMVLEFSKIEGKSQSIIDFVENNKVGLIDAVYDKAVNMLAQTGSLAPNTSPVTIPTQLKLHGNAGTFEQVGVTVVTQVMGMVDGVLTDGAVDKTKVEGQVDKLKRVLVMIQTVARRVNRFIAGAKHLQEVLGRALTAAVAEVAQCCPCKIM